MIFNQIIIIVINQQPDAGAPAGAAESQSYQPPVPTPAPGMVSIRCAACGWDGVYTDTTKARQGLGAHSRFCKKRSALNRSPFYNPFR